MRARWKEWGRVIGSRGCVVALALSFAVFAKPLAAQPTEPPQPKYGWREVWSGADATRDIWLLYSGITLAPWSDDIYSQGFRLRVASGYGQYKYDYTRSNALLNPACQLPPYPTCVRGPKTYSGSASLTYTDVLIGYHARFGELTAKAFAGPSFSSLKPSAEVENVDFYGTEFGIKGALELWLNLGKDAWTSLDLSYATSHETSAARWRAGWRPTPEISIGPELRYDRNIEGSSARGGVFARYQWHGGEVSLAGGIAGSMFGIADERDYAPYGTANVLFQY